MQPPAEILRKRLKQGRDLGTLWACKEVYYVIGSLQYADSRSNIYLRSSYSVSGRCGTALRRGRIVSRRGGIILKRGRMALKRGGIVLSRGGMVLKRGGMVLKRGGMVLRRGGMVLRRG